jgi:hypothetical protein
MKKFDELTQKELREMYDKMVKQEQAKVAPKQVRWRAERGQIYYFVDLNGEVYDNEENFDQIDNFLYESGNYFKTEEEAEEHKKKLLYQQEYKDWCKFDIDWNDDSQDKWYVYWFSRVGCISPAIDTRHKSQGVVYAESTEKIQEFIEKISEENFKKYILEVK